jgi:hypothetical protein
VDDNNDLRHDDNADDEQLGSQFGVRHLPRPVLDEQGRPTGEEQVVAVRVEPLTLGSAAAAPDHPPRQRRHDHLPVGSAAVGPRPKRTTRTTVPSLVTVATFVVAAAVAGIAFASAVVLGRLDATNPWVPVLQDFLKTAYQALAIGALGGLVKLIMDRRRKHLEAAAELQARERARRQAMTAQVTTASHQVDSARFLIAANRSVKSWSEAITGPIDIARSQLRSMAHEITNSEQAGQPLFLDSDAIRRRLLKMCDYLMALITEHADNKQRLGELQRRAEHGTADRPTALEEVWHELTALEHLADLVDRTTVDPGDDDDAPTYGGFRSHYFAVLFAMRTELHPNA